MAVIYDEYEGGREVGDGGVRVSFMGDGWVDGWMEGWMDGWMDGWVDGGEDLGMNKILEEWI